MKRMWWEPSVVGGDLTRADRCRITVTAMGDLAGRCAGAACGRPSWRRRGHGWSTWLGGGRTCGALPRVQLTSGAGCCLPSS